MMRVTTYNVYVGPQTSGGQQMPELVLFGDAQKGVVSIDHPGPSVIDVITVGGLGFAAEAVSWAEPVSCAEPVNWCGWAGMPAGGAMSITELAVSVVNASPGMLTLQLNMSDGQSVPMTILKSL